MIFAPDVVCNCCHASAVHGKRTLRPSGAEAHRWTGHLLPLDGGLLEPVVTNGSQRPSDSGEKTQFATGTDVRAWEYVLCIIIIFIIMECLPFTTVLQLFSRDNNNYCYRTIEFALERFKLTRHCPLCAYNSWKTKKNKQCTGCSVDVVQQ